MTTEEPPIYDECIVEKREQDQETSRKRPDSDWNLFLLVLALDAMMVPEYLNGQEVFKQFLKCLQIS